MVQARIFKPAKTAMQCGKAKTRKWILEFCPQKVSFIDPIMGWWGSQDTNHQVRLTFPSLEAAKAYALEKNLDVQIEPEHIPISKPKCYADNFRYNHVV